MSNGSKGDKGADGAAGAAGTNGIDGVDGVGGGRNFKIAYLSTGLGSTNFLLDLVNNTFTFGLWVGNMMFSDDATSFHRREASGQTLDFSGVAESNDTHIVIYYNKTTGDFGFFSSSSPLAYADDIYIVTNFVHNGTSYRTLGLNSSSISVRGTGDAMVDKWTILGDSHTEGGEVWIQEAMRLHGGIAERVNMGLGGSKVAADGGGNYYDRLVGADALGVGGVAEGTELLTIYGLSNDGITATTIGTLKTDGSPYTTTSVYGSLQAMIEYAHTTDPLIRIQLIACQHKFNTTTGAEDDYDAYRLAMKNVAEFYNLPFMDLSVDMGFNGFNWASFYNADGLHWVDTGRLVFARKIAAFIKNNY